MSHGLSTYTGSGHIISELPHRLRSYLLGPPIPSILHSCVEGRHCSDRFASFPLIAFPRRRTTHCAASGVAKRATTAPCGFLSSCSLMLNRINPSPYYRASSMYFAGGSSYDIPTICTAASDTSCPTPLYATAPSLLWNGFLHRVHSDCL